MANAESMKSQFASTSRTYRGRGCFLRGYKHYELRRSKNRSRAGKVEHLSTALRSSWSCRTHSFSVGLYHRWFPTSRLLTHLSNDQRPWIRSERLDSECQFCRIRSSAHHFCHRLLSRDASSDQPEVVDSQYHLPCACGSGAGE